MSLVPSWRRHFAILVGLPLVVTLLTGRTLAEMPQATSAVQTPAIEQPAPPVQFESAVLASDVRPHVEYLASPELKGRSGPNARIAAEYIQQRFERWGLKPLFPGDNYFQEIPGARSEEGAKSIAGRNVGAWIEGSDPALRDEVLIISAHYDHLGVRGGRIYRGADDNASGVAMLLEVARCTAAAAVKPRRSIAFIGFDLEERMLWGSRWFVAHPPWPLAQIKLFITADMIGRSLGDLPLPVVFVLGSEHAPRLKDVLSRVGTPHGLEVARLGIDLIGTRSDYGPFRDASIPFLFFSTGQHPDYHTPQDIPERIDYARVAKISGLVHAICDDVANADETPEWTDDVATNLDEARALNRIATLMLQSRGSEGLSDVQQLLLSHTKNRTAQIIERGSMSPLERTWLVRVSQLMLLSVF